MASPETNYAPSPACDAEMSIECSGFRSFTPPVRVMSSVVMMRTCEPCGGVEVEARRADGEHDPNEAALAMVLENCERRRRHVAAMTRQFPWLKPAESGAEQLEAWRTARGIICPKWEMLGVVAGTLWLARQKGGPAMPPTVSSHAVDRLPIGNSCAQKMHQILSEHRLVNTHQDRKTRICSFTILSSPVWLEFALMPEVRVLVTDLSINNEHGRRYAPCAKTDYMTLVDSLRHG